MKIERDSISLSKTYMHKHVNDVSNRIIWPEAERIRISAPTKGKIPKTISSTETP